MLGIRIICVGKLKERFYIDAVDEYKKRLTSHCKIEILNIPEHRLPDDPSQAQITQALAKECAAIKVGLMPGSMAVAMSSEGRQMDSREFSELLTECACSGISRLVFVIGGSFGLHEKVKKEADLLLSMSAMTFPHNLAQVILLEQLYRAFKITDGGKYHK